MKVWLVFTVLEVFGFLPGITEKKYQPGSTVELFAGTLTSSRTQLPFEYYYLPFCNPEKQAMDFDNIGQALTGDVLEKTSYEILMGTNKKCSFLCTRNVGPAKIKAFRWMIVNDYRVQWFLDSLPAGVRISDLDQKLNLAIYQDGFPIGYVEHGKYYIYNHHHIIIKVGKKKGSIVGFLVQPLSLYNDVNFACDSDDYSKFYEDLKGFQEEYKKVKNEDELLEIQVQNYFEPQPLVEEISFTYSVSFEQSSVSWASRWDIYLYSAGGKVHWIAIVNSFVMVLLLTFIVGDVFKRAVSRDISSYNDDSEITLETDSGWKQLKGDVFRNPDYSGLFSILVGTGFQIITMSFCTLIFACVGFLSPDHRGYLVTVILLLFAMTGIVAGLVSGRLYKMFGGTHWKKSALGTALLIPGSFFLIFFLINSLISLEDSTLDVSFWSLLELLLIWLGISLPLTFLGSALGYKNVSLTNPVAISRIPKPLPLSFPIRLYGLMILCSSLPFGSVLVELNFVMNSVWNHQNFYYLFGFLLLCFLLLLVVSGEISVLAVYVTLCRDEYRWWWISFLVPASSSVYMLIYAWYYYKFQLDLISFTSTVMYFGYMTLGCIVFGLITGAIGFFASFMFVRKIYSLIKQE
jgi:transmembrane 9 superfamily protein 2/4